MRSNHNPSGAINRSAGARNVEAGMAATKVSLPVLPVEWLDAGTWRLPSGKALAEFALQAGFLAPLLFRGERFSRVSESALPPRGKQIVKGVGR